ncbi:MAG TPA: ElyC/SanA/YdcF family protein, partial [Pyrinomonadaceae bacterium]|nr:ElyC/SanA/YdcF family protein [Pyrinomonadaceae bacterium]
VAFSTRGEAILLKEYAEEERFRSVLIVTSSYHSRRALRTMEQVFAGNGIAIGLETSSTPPAAFWWVRPQGWRTVGSEFLKTVYYWLNYE